MKKITLTFFITVLLSMSNTFAQSGTTGDLTWNLQHDQLTISGHGAMPDFRWGGAPWYLYQEFINTIILETGVTNIGSYAFAGCTRLTSITIPINVKNIGAYTFVGCENLTSIHVESENYYYASENGVLFDKRKTTLICYPGGKQGEYVIPNTVTSIRRRAFYASNLTSVTIPKSVTSIGNDAFEFCKTLVSIDVETGNNNYFSDDGVLLNNYKTVLICCPAGKTGEYVIPNSVKKIEYEAFYFSKLTLITIPESVTKIEDRAFYASCVYAINLPNSVTSIGTAVFLRCSNLISVTIPNSVTSIGNDAFSFCESLDYVTIPNSVTKIGNEAFSACKTLSMITIPESVTSIGNNAFFSCENLTLITNLSAVPVVINSNVFKRTVQSKCTLIVPEIAVSAYENAEVWKEFNIEGF